MASHPTFEPAVLTKPFTQERYEALTGEDTGKPLFNRAIAGQYPTGSTFKAITALAGLEKGLITPGAVINDTGCITVGEAERCNARDAKYGAVDLGARAAGLLRRLLLQARDERVLQPRRRLVIQRYARKLGFGRATGIDLPGEDDGVIPDKDWRNDINEDERDCRKQKGISLRANVFAAGAAGCGISDLRDYNLGDNASLAVGQGDLQATPLQLAVAYAAIANKGKVVVPHLGLEIERANGELVQRIERDPARRVDIDEDDRQAVAHGLHLAASEAGGTSADVFGGWPQDALPVYGKTGTAERQPKADQSWYVAYVPDPKRPIVVAATVEEGGFGAATGGADRVPHAGEVLRPQERPLRARRGPVAVNEPTPSRLPAGLRLPFDPLLALAAIGLMAASLVTLNASTSKDVPGDPHFYVTRQGVFFAIGTLLAIVLSRIDYSRFRELKYGIYGLMMAGLLLVAVFGGVTRGSRRAIQLPFFEVQASELGKVLLIVALAAFVVDRSRRLGERDTTARLVLVGMVPAMFVMVSDLGSGLVYIAILFAALFVAGVSWRHFAGLITLGIVSIALVLTAAPALGVTVLTPEQSSRLTSFLSPSDVAGDAGYQQNQSRIAIGSGQKTGRGELATQSTLNFLPEERTDFAFAVVGERWGFAGAGLLLSLYALLVWRGLRILTMAKNLYGALIAGGVVAMLLFQVFINVGMNVGIMPITGIPLPLFSYGGSSVLATLLAIGLLQSIYAQGRFAAATKRRGLPF